MPTDPLQRLRRQQRILDAIPSHPGVSAQDLLVRLGDAFETLHSPASRLRALQRDLNRLMAHGRIIRRHAGGRTPLYLRQSGNERDALIREYELEQAHLLALQLNQPMAMEQLIHNLAHEGGLLDDGKLIIKPASLPLTPAVIKPGVLTSVLQALSSSLTLDVTYRNRHEERNTLCVHPQFLEQYGPALYLHVTDRRGNRRKLSLHRMVRATLGAEPFQARPAAAAPERLQMKAWVRGYIADLLLDFPLHHDQTLTELPHDNEFDYLLTVTLPDSGDTRRWILAGGRHIRVLEPAALRDKLARQAREMARMYDNR